MGFSPGRESQNKYWFVPSHNQNGAQTEQENRVEHGGTVKASREGGTTPSRSVIPSDFSNTFLILWIWSPDVDDSAPSLWNKRRWRHWCESKSCVHPVQIEAVLKEATPHRGCGVRAISRWSPVVFKIYKKKKKEITWCFEKSHSPLTKQNRQL